MAKKTPYKGPGVVYSCEECGALFDHQIAAIGHERAKHGMHSPARETGRKLSGIVRCPHCPITFKDHSGMSAEAWRADHVIRKH